MGLVLDAVFAAIVLCFVVAGYRAGLMRTLVEFVGYLFAVVASVVLAGLVADVLADLFLQARAPSPHGILFLAGDCNRHCVCAVADAGADDRLRGERRVPATVVAYGRQPVGLPVWGI